MDPEQPHLQILVLLEEATGKNAALAKVTSRREVESFLSLLRPLDTTHVFHWILGFDPRKES